jgi:Ca-activated chloride channel family protein
MDTVTDRGRGAYVYIDSFEEAERMFFARFDETMEVAARSVQVELTLPWYFQMQKFYGEEYSEDPKEIEPQHLAPGDAMVFNQVIAACDPAVVVGSDAITVRTTWSSPVTYLPTTEELTMTVDELLAGAKEQLHKGKAIVAYAEALKTGTHDDLAAAHEAVLAANPNGTDAALSEIAELIELIPAFAAPSEP